MVTNSETFCVSLSIPTCGQSGHGHFGHFRFRIRSFGSLYININIYYIVADFDTLEIDFDQNDHDHFDRERGFAEKGFRKIL